MPCFESSCLLCSAFEAELADVIPVVKTSIAGTRIIGRLLAGNDHFFPLSHTKCLLDEAAFAY